MLKELLSLPHAILWPRAFVCLPTYCDYAPKYRGLTVGQLVKMPARRTAAGSQSGRGRCMGGGDWGWCWPGHEILNGGGTQFAIFMRRLSSN